jgi:hypothetical protein
MVAIPWQRPSLDTWTVTLTPVQSVTAAIAAVRKEGWSVVAAIRVPDGVELILRR